MNQRSLFKSVVVLLLIPVFVACNSKKESTKIYVNPEFSTYVSAFSSGQISRESIIKVVLTQSIDTSKFKIGEALPEGLFDFSPSIDGVAKFSDPFTIEFTPEKWFKSETNYKVEFSLDEIQKVPKDFQEFEFDFTTPILDYNVNFKGFDKNSTYEVLNLSGVVVFSDVIDTAQLVTLLKVNSDNEVVWNKAGTNIYDFSIQKIKRKKASYSTEIKLNGSDLGIDKQIVRSYTIPALGDFKVTDVEVDNGIEQSITIYFSDPLSKKGKIESFISVDGDKNCKVVVLGNEVKVYPSKRINGEKKLLIEAGVKNSKNYGMSKAQEFTLSFFAIKPQIELLGKGTVLPSAQEGLLFPFRAVNVNSVVVSITKVYTDNIGQFLQVNELSGTYQLHRVSKKVLRKRISLKSLSNVNLSEWNDFHLDLSEYVNVDPGAIYRVELRLDKRGSNFPCKDASKGDDLTEIEMQSSIDDWDDESTSRGYYYDDYDYYTYYGNSRYDYAQKENPCNNSYYRYKSVSKNILASNLGITVKAGSDRKYHVYVSDLLTVQPKGHVEVELLDYQQQVVGVATTDGSGMVAISPKRKPFLVIVKDGDKRGYLKIRNGLSLSTSKFETSGQTNKDGIKGFLYTERGVRRPGDSIYVGFMIEDQSGKIPDLHPVHFELVNPKGKTMKKQVMIGNKNGIYVFKTTTDMDDPTGSWGCRAKIGNASFYKEIKVESVKPNRLKILLDFHQKIVTKNKTPKADLEVKWLHGAVARDLDVKVEMHLASSYGDFKEHKDFVFKDPLYSYSSSDQIVFEDKIDNDGKASFKPKFEVGEFVPGMLTAFFKTRVFEKTGDFSVDKFSVKFSPYDSYVGVAIPKGGGWGNVLETGKDHQIGVVVVDEKGKALKRKGVKVKVYRIDRNWWYDNYNRDLANYINRSSTELILDSVMDIKEKGSYFKMREEYPNWGRYLIRVTDPVSGHSSGKLITIDWPYWRRASRNNQDFATMLNFQSNKKSYAVGEDINVSFPTSGKEKALVTIENGTSVIKSFWIETSDKQTEFNIKATKEMAPNIYVSISLIQKHGNTGNDLPIRMYGTIPVGVEDPNSHLSPLIDLAKEIRPESTASIGVSEKDGKEMYYTLAIVDEGLLDLTRFKTPKPWKHFYAKQALGVKTWDMYDQVIGSYGAQLNRILGIGGDGAIDKKGGKKANRFKPMVRFLGEFKLKAGEKVIHKVKIPNYIGSCRVMVVARSNKSYGSAEKYVKVKKPLMVLATLPRVLGPNEEVNLPVNVFALKENLGKVKVTIESNQFLKSVGPKTKTITFKESGDKIVLFPLKVSKNIGIGKIKVTVTGGNESAKHEIEIDVRAPNPEITDVIEVAIDPGKSWSSPLKYPGMDGTTSGAFEVSSFPSINITGRLRYLIRYPHGCIEQTTSSVFPQLHLGNVVELNDIQKLKIIENITNGISRITKFQTSEGGFSYWPGEPEPSEWGSNYAGHFLLEAKAKGYKVPTYLLDNWLTYQKRKAKRWNYGGDRYYNYSIQAYRLYVLALAGSPDFSAMNQLKSKSNLNKTAKWRLAGAYALAGQAQVANEIIEKLNTEVADYRELSYSYGSGTRDKAMILEVLTEMGKRGRGASLAKDIAHRMNSRRWMSTQTTAYSLLSLSKFLGESEKGKMMQFNYLLSGKSQTEVNARIPVYKKELIPTKDNKLTIKNTGKSVLFVKVIQSGTPDQDDRSATNSNVKMSIVYKDMDGRVISPDSILQGTDFKAEVSLFNPGTKGYLREMALNQIFPSGWEIHNSRMDLYNSEEGSRADYKDIRDDRVYTYYKLGSGSRKTFTVKLNAAYKGKFYLPTVETEAMYDNSINARTPGKWVIVK
jgi:uncharacterized protein YfaS (alpha-2-macroglobulin family)